MDSKAKCLLITGKFEGASFGTVDDAKDGQGWSLGVIQWNYGRGTAQPLIQDFYLNGAETFRKCCTQTVNGVLMDLTNELLDSTHMTPEAGVAWCKAHEDANGQPLPHWKAAFAALGAEPGFDNVEATHAGYYMNTAMGYVRQFGFKSERALALMFDTCVQEGSVSAGSLARYTASLAVANDTSELTRLRAMAIAVGPQAGPYASDVESRRLCIVNGKGVVHGQNFDLRRLCGLGDGPIV